MTLIDKENGREYIMSHEKSDEHKYASRGVAGAGLGLGIAGTALGLLNGGLNGLGLFGGRGAWYRSGWGYGYGCGNGETINIVNETRIADQVLQNEHKECEDVLTLTNGMWQHVYNQQNQRFADRSTLNSELFGIYSDTQNKFAAATSKQDAANFSLYKYSRDSKDELSEEIGALRTEVAVLKATRPYQDKIIQMQIENAAQVADFNLAHRTCRMIQGEVVLPNTPVVTGFGSYRSCCCGNQTTASTTPAQ